MSRLRAWTWKEAREHRWVLLGLWLAVALITATPFIAFRAESTRVDLDRLPVAAVALATLVLGLDLFARETRRGTHALILRTPGALRWAFPAKLLLLIAGTLGALAIEEALRHSLSALTGVPYPFRVVRVEGEWRRVARSMRPETAFGIEMAVLASLVAAAVGTWHVAGSVVSPRAGVGALCGVLTLAVLGMPILLLHEQHPWWFQFPTNEAYAWVAGIGAAGLAVALVAWYSGRRFLLPRKTPAIHGGIAALVLAGLATGGTAYAVDRWEAVNWTAPEFRIESGFLGEGGKRLYLTTSRGGLYGDLTAPTHRQSPPFAWSVLLADPAGHGDVHSGAYFQPPPGGPSARSLVSIPYVVRVDEELPHRDPHTDQWTWIDTTTDATRLVGGMRTLSVATIEAARGHAKATTPLRDSRGRRVWWIEGVVERDGDEGLVPVPSPTARREDRIAGISFSGWLVSDLVGGARPGDSRWARKRIGVETGTAATTVFDAPDVSPPDFEAKAKDGGIRTGQSIELVGSTKFLIRRNAELPTGSIDTGWLLWDSTEPDRFETSRGPPLGHDIMLVTQDTMLAREEDPQETVVGARANTRLVLWKPLTGERTPVESSDASLLSPGHLESIGRLPDGRHLLWLHDRTGFRRGRQALALFDLPTRTITGVAPWSDAGWDPIAFDADGSLLVIEGNRRVVRLASHGAKREVVWPK